jgi:hypothetical protein
MLKGAPATPGRPQSKAAGTPVSASPAAQRGHRAVAAASERQDAADGSGSTVKASRGARSAPAAAANPGGIKPPRAAASAQAKRGASPPTSASAAEEASTTASAGAADMKVALAATLPPGSIVYPAHAAVLISTSDYFRRYFDSWHDDGGSRVVAIEVEPEELEAATMMLR